MLATDVVEKHCILPMYEHGWPGVMWMTLHYLDKTAKKWKRVGHKLEENTVYLYENSHKELKVFETRVKTRISDSIKIYYLSEFETAVALRYPIEQLSRWDETQPKYNATYQSTD